MERLKAGLVIAKPEKDLEELREYLSDSSAEIFLFPEAHFHSDELEEVRKLVAQNKKWLVVGMDDYRTAGKRFQTGVVIGPEGKVALEHKKTSLTKGEIKLGYDIGNTLDMDVVETPFGKIAIGVCYELHVPEVARVYALAGVEIIFNPIGTGMFHERQFMIWTNMAQTRAYENGVFVVGCSHYNEAIPLAFAFAPNGECLLRERGRGGLITISLDPAEQTFGRNFDKRKPELYREIVKEK